MSKTRGAIADPLLSVVMPVYNERETIAAKIIQRKYRVYEMPITYDGRGYGAGKTIGWRDGIVALWVLLKYRFTE